MGLYHNSGYNTYNTYNTYILSWLVVLTCFNHLEKYEFVNGNDDIPYMKCKIKNG